MSKVVPSPKPQPHKWIGPWNKSSEIAAANVGVIGNATLHDLGKSKFKQAMLHDLGKSKFKQSKSFDANITKYNAKEIDDHMLHDLGKHKMQQGYQLIEEIDTTSSDLIAGLFGDAMSKKFFREAQVKQAQEDQANMEAIDNQFASAAAVDQKLKDASKIEGQQHSTRYSTVFSTFFALSGNEDNDLTQRLL